MLPFGLWLVDLDGFGYDAGWVQAALVLFVAVAVLGAAGDRRPKRARLVASRLAREHEDESEELRALLDDPLSRALNYLSALLVLAIVVLMVFKPA